MIVRRLVRRTIHPIQKSTTNLFPIEALQHFQMYKIKDPCHTKTAMPKRLSSFPVRALRDRRIRLKILHFPEIACTQCSLSVHTTSTRRFHSAVTASMILLRRARSCCSVFTARSARAYSVLMAIIPFVNFFTFFIF